MPKQRERKKGKQDSSTPSEHVEPSPSAQQDAPPNAAESSASKRKDIQAATSPSQFVDIFQETVIQYHGEFNAKETVIQYHGEFNAKELAISDAMKLYESMRHLPPERVKQAIVGHFEAIRSHVTPSNLKDLVPVMNHINKYREVCEKHKEANKAFKLPAVYMDSARSICVLPFRREQRKNAVYGGLYTDHLSIDNTNANLTMETRTQVAIAYHNIQPNDGMLEFSYLAGGHILQVQAVQDGLVASRLLLPDFLAALRSKLQCKPIDELVVIPLAKNRVLATKASSALGCCQLGDIADALNPTAPERSRPDYITCIPYRKRVLHVDTSKPPRQ
eukprot:g79538.t1